MLRQRLIRMLGVGLLLAGLGYSGLCLLVYRNQSALLFFPDPTVRQSPADLGLDFQDLWLQTSDGRKIHGWAVPGPPGSPWVVHCHGNGGNIEYRLEIVRGLHDLGLSVLVFDYRGYGRSPGPLPTQETELVADGEAAYAWAAERHAPIILMGESLGGGVATALAALHPGHLLILQSTFTSVVDRAAEAYPFLPVRTLSRFRLPSRERVAHLQAPVLVMHSPQDEVIGFHHGRALFAAASEPKVFVELQGGHNDRQPALMPAIADFLARYGPKTGPD